MFQKYLHFALRSFKKNKATVAINILGLAVGISASLVIFLIVQYDFNFDKWEPDRAQIYRVYTQLGEQNTNNGINMLAPQKIAQEIAGIKNLAHFYDASFLNFAEVNGSGQKKLMRDLGSTVFADQQYFNIFPYQWLAGSPTNLSTLNTIVLSESEVGKFFPGQDYHSVIGKAITFDDSINLTVKGVVADLTQQSDFDYKNFISLKTFTETPLKYSDGSISWNSVSGSSQCFVRLAAGAKPAKIDQQIKAIYLREVGNVESKYRQNGQLQPLSDIHFNTNIDGKVSKSSLVNLGVLAFLLLLLAVINFINLSTAQSSLRAKEIGIRKTFGSSHQKIVFQFLTETFLLTVFATLFALILSPLLLHIFKGFVPEGLGIMAMFSPLILLFVIIIILMVTVLAGLYPAFVLTKFKPVAVLKNQPTRQGKSRSAGLRQVLTVSQFVIAQVFLIVVVIMGKQIHYMLNKDLGFRKNAIISFFIPRDTQEGKNDHKSILLSQLKAVNSIQDLSISSGAPTLNGWSTNTATLLQNGQKVEFDNVHIRNVDNNYLPVFDLKLLAGRNIVVDTASIFGEVLINETLMHDMGIQNPGKIVGQYMMCGRDSSQIVGVLKDFTTQNLHNSISPTMIAADDHGYGNIVSILLDAQTPQNWPSAIASMEKVFKNLYPDAVFNYTFYDESIKNLYKTDMRLSTLLKWATGLAIFISCLGLLGLVSFMANQRTKEIGIRKVLGASVSSIITLLSQNLIRLVLLASVIAFPFAWYFSHQWLHGFAFKTTIDWIIFVACAAGMLLIALLVLWLRTVKAARVNPVQSLRDE